MQLAASDVRRRARYHLIRGGTPGMAQGMALMGSSASFMGWSASILSRR
jgi:hypothetical protein